MKSIYNVYEGILDDDFLDVVKDEATKEDIATWLKANYDWPSDTYYEINRDGKDWVVNCNWAVNLHNRKVTSLTNGHFRWGTVRSFYCLNSDIISLEGAPQQVWEEFNCQGCKNLKSLKYAPKKCRTFNCSDCGQITSLEGTPTTLHTLNCAGTSIRNLKGGPKTVSVLDLTGCKNLSSFEGCPKKVALAVHCHFCKSLKSLQGFPRMDRIGVMSFYNCVSLKSLEGCPTEIYKLLDITGCEDLEQLDGAPRYVKRLEMDSGKFERSYIRMHMDVDDIFET